VSRNRIELVGEVVFAPEVRTTPAGTPVVTIEVDCNEGREVLRLGVVMAGQDAREVGARIKAGAAVKVRGTLRAARGSAWSSMTNGVEILASEIVEVAKNLSS
jgi:primosomal replication protein N